MTRGVCLGSGRAGQATARVGSQTGRVAVLNVLSNSIFFETTDEQNCTLTILCVFILAEIYLFDCTGGRREGAILVDSK